jgi:hypothetical protein
MDASVARIGHSKSDADRLFHCGVSDGPAMPSSSSRREIPAAQGTSLSEEEIEKLRCETLILKS